MLTPSFKITQDEEFLTIIISAPYVKASDVEIYIEDFDFKFYAKPYFLRLNLPKQVVEDGRESAKYDVDKGEFTIRVPKMVSGEHFPDLDMLTKLLASRKKAATKPLIEVVGGDGITCGVEDEVLGEDGCPMEEEEDEYQWEIEQEVFDEEAIKFDGYKYGFANKVNGVFDRFQGEITDLIDLPNPDKLSHIQRRNARIALENDKFDPEYYLADLFEDDIIQELIKFRTFWNKLYKSGMVAYHKAKNYEVVIPDFESEYCPGLSSYCKVEFEDFERKRMTELPNKEYLLSKNEEQSLFLNLVDIIFAYCYNNRITEGENNAESAWNIAKLSATLSCMETYTSLTDVVIGSFRRSLCYPLYRNWSLSLTVWQDVLQIFSIGKKCLLKCLLDCRCILQNEDPYYVLSDLYITDYCVWIQTVSKKAIDSLAHKIQQTKFTKADVALDLPALESAANIVNNEDCEASSNGKSISSDSSDSDSDSTEYTSESDSDDEDRIESNGHPNIVGDTTATVTTATVTTATVTEIQNGIEEMTMHRSPLIEEIEASHDIE